MSMSVARSVQRCVLPLCNHQPRRFFVALPRAPATRSRPTLAIRSLHLTPQPHFPRKRDFFSSNVGLQEHQASRRDREASSERLAKRQTRSLPGKTSLRRVAVEAQRSRDGLSSGRQSHVDDSVRRKRVRAYCSAEQFDLAKVVAILEDEGYDIDPYHTDLYPQVVHIRVPRSDPQVRGPLDAEGHKYGDVFIFPSGTLVAWSLSEASVSKLVTKTLLPAAINPHLAQMETEDLDYLEDPHKENSGIRGDMITIGTGPKFDPEEEPHDGSRTRKHDLSSDEDGDRADITLAKIAFSSGLARSTKLAVLETLLSSYFESTRSIPTMLSKGSRLPFTRSFILRKTGQLLSVRAQLNLYSELTDSLPDLFWDSRHELGLEGYYDQVGRALDVGVRIKVLNEKMDYAQEIASVLRERLSEKHGLILEWMIIALITIEVAFEVLRLWKERKERLSHEADRSP